MIRKPSLPAAVISLSPNGPVAQAKTVDPQGPAVSFAPELRPGGIPPERKTNELSARKSAFQIGGDRRTAGPNVRGENDLRAATAPYECGTCKTRPRPAATRSPRQDDPFN